MMELKRKLLETNEKVEQYDWIEWMYKNRRGLSFKGLPFIKDYSSIIHLSNV
jgi:hypothetical protein